MAIDWMDGFEKYGASSANAALATGSWVVASGTLQITTSSPRGSSGVNNLTGNSSGSLYRPFSAARATSCVGMAFRNDGSSRDAMQIRDGSTAHLTVQWVGATQSFKLFRGDSSTGTLLGQSANVGGANIAGTTWCYLELAFTIDDSAGAYELRINGIPASDPVGSGVYATGADTRNGGNATADRVFINVLNVSVRWDDVYVTDDGSFLNAITVLGLYPSGAGTTTQWTPLSGSNYANVDENPSTADTDYNSSNVAGQIDTYAMGDISGTGTVKGVQVSNQVRLETAGSRSVAAEIRTNSNNCAGTTKVITNTTYLDTIGVWDTNPNTGQPWTVTEVNAIECGIQLVA